MGIGWQNFHEAIDIQGSLYIKLEVEQTIKGDIEKIYLVWYPIFEKKETSWKEIVWGHTTQNYLDRRFLMNQGLAGRVG